MAHLLFVVFQATHFAVQRQDQVQKYKGLVTLQGPRSSYTFNGGNFLKILIFSLPKLTN